MLKESLNRLSGPVTSCSMLMTKKEQLDQQGNSAKAGLACFDRASSPICASLRSKLIIVDGVTTRKEQITWLLSSATSSSARYAALIVRQSPTPSKPSSCVRMLQGTWATISAVSSRNCLLLVAMPSPAPLIAPPRDVRASASKSCMNCCTETPMVSCISPMSVQTRSLRLLTASGLRKGKPCAVSRVPNSPPSPAQRLNIEKEFIGTTLAVSLETETNNARAHNGFPGGVRLRTRGTAWCGG